jgi:hypothetical protein
VDFTHFYDMSTDLHNQLHNLLIKTFGESMCEPPSDTKKLSDMTLNYFEKQKCNIIIIYNDENRPANAWPGSYRESPWGNVQNSDDLFNVSPLKYNGGFRIR